MDKKIIAAILVVVLLACCIISYFVYSMITSGGESLVMSSFKECARGSTIQLTQKADPSGTFKVKEDYEFSGWVDNKCQMNAVISGRTCEYTKQDVDGKTYSQFATETLINKCHMQPSG